MKLSKYVKILLESGINSDDRDMENAMRYFSIGHDEENENNNFVWIWNGTNIVAKRGRSHGIHFGHEIADRTFKGRYDASSNELSIVFPQYFTRKLDHEPTLDDLPENIYRALLRKFGSPQKKTPRFSIFENKIFENEEAPFKAYWLDPHGNFHEVEPLSSNAGHWAFAQKYCHEKGINYNNDENDNSPIIALYKRKWVRVVFNYGFRRQLAISYIVPYNPMIVPPMKRAIENKAKELNATEIIDDVTRNKIKLEL